MNEILYKRADEIVPFLAFNHTDRSQQLKVQTKTHINVLQTTI